MGPEKIWYQFVQQQSIVQSLKDFDVELSCFPKQQERASMPREIIRLEGLNLSASHVSAQISSSTPFPPAPLSWNERSSRVEHFIDVTPYRPSNQALGLEPEPYLPCNLQGRGTLSKLPWKLILHACSQLDIHSLHSSFFLLYTI